MSEEKDNQAPNTIKKILRNIIIIFFIALVVAAIALLGYLKWALATPLSDNSEKEIFEVKAGQTSQQIGRRLVERKIIRSEWVFYLNARFKNLSFKTGLYDLSSNMSIIQVSEQMAEGKTGVVKITIPEGYRREQIAQLFLKNGLDGQQFLNKTEGMEGYLFPDTYYFLTEETIDEVVSIMRKNFDERTSGLALAKEDLIIASIVEREAIKDGERPVIAGVYKNRIKINMKLEADPTVQFGKDTNSYAAVGLGEYKFWKPLVRGDYQNVISDFNTYRISTLPPTPICNPGIASINATVNYTEHAYLYFFQTKGEIYLSKTFAEHDAKVNQYLR